MSKVQLREAKAKLSALVKQAAKGGAVIITHPDEPQAVIIGIDEWKRLREASSFGYLLANCPMEEGDLAPRDASPPSESGRLLN